MCSFSVGFSLLISDWSDQRPMSGVSIEVRANLTDVRQAWTTSRELE